eukprot:3605230-Amphidinium_carterae.1
MSRWEEALLCFVGARATMLQPDRGLISAAIAAHGRSSSWVAALELLRESLEGRLAPDVRLYNAAL